MRFLALDPSIHNIGWAHFDSSKKTMKEAWNGGTIKVNEPNIQRVCTECVTQLQLLQLPIDFLVTEMPTFFNSERGHVAAKQNYTIDLAAISFYVAGFLRLRPNRHVPITAITWKGNVTKEITARRFYKSLGKKLANLYSITEHQIDATMMLRWFLLTYVVKGKLSSLCNPPPDWQSLLAIGQ